VADNPSSKLRNSLLTTLVSSAFFSWQSALIIALSILLFAFSVTPAGLPAFFWLIFGALGVALFVVATVTDQGAQQRILEGILRDKYNPDDIKNDGARRRLEQALEYYAAIQKLVATRNAASRVEFQSTLDEIDKWIEHLYELGKRIDQFDENQIINRDRIRARNELDELRRRLKAEPDERVQAELKRSIEIKETQLENLKTLEANVKRADIQMDNTLAALGTVYTQLQLIGSKSIDRGSAQRLQNQVHDQIMDLQDTIAAIDEVQSYQTS
jgi:hypothetical protein